MEAAALTKGSQRVMNDKNLMANLADSIRDDARSHPAAFPPGSSRTFQKAQDEQLAQWFLENIDNIEREGYEGTVYSRDGVNSEWIVRRYIAGSHNWEDLTGVMNMNLRDWYLLKNRNMLDVNHKDLPKFNSVRDVGYYMTTHYENKLVATRDAAKNAARNKMAKSVKLIDNEDYRVYTTLNRAAGCLLGLGTQWCTANSNTGTHFHSYAGANMLFQLFPYAKEKDKEGNIEVKKDEEGKKVLDAQDKYQFDSGGSFMNITDSPAPPKTIAGKFPYLYTDLTRALKDNKGKLEQAFKELSDDPTLQGEDYKIKTYEIDDVINKLEIFINRGHFTNQVRPRSVSSAEAPAGEQPQIQQNPKQGNQAMESIRELAEAMLSIESEELNEFYFYKQSDKGKKNDAFKKKEDKDAADKKKQEKSDWKKKQSGKLDEEENTIKGKTMENVDKDVAAMLSSLKKYDRLVESVSPVLGMVTLGEKKKPDFPDLDKDGDKKETMAKALQDKKDGQSDSEGGEIDESSESNPWEKLATDKKDDNAKTSKTSKTSKGGTVTKTEKGLIHKAAEKKEVKEAVEETADEEVLAWMGRFAALGNMKGYGR